MTNERELRARARIYKVKARRAYPGKDAPLIWNAYTRLGYSATIFPGIAGAPSLDDMMNRIDQILRQQAEKSRQSRNKTAKAYGIPAREL